MSCALSSFPRGSWPPFGGQPTPRKRTSSNTTREISGTIHINGSSFVATASPAPVASPVDGVVTNDGWYPDVNLADMRDAMRLDGTVTAERIRHATRDVVTDGAGGRTIEHVDDSADRALSDSNAWMWECNGRADGT